MQLQTQQQLGDTTPASGVLEIDDASTPVYSASPTTDSQQQDAIAKLDTRMRQCFKTTIGKQLGLSNHYTAIAVLIVHWASDLDPVLRCWEEAQELEKLFRERLHYKTTLAVIDNKSKLPQHQLHKAISDFVYYNDGPEGSNLMIVYYSGHGYAHCDSPHNLIVSGTSTGDPTKVLEAYPPNADWTKATATLDGAQADTLVILDCCNAGNIMKNGNQSTRAYEIMAATGRNTPTESPGPGSYSHALIKCLDELLTRKAPFTTYDLHQMIQKRRDYNTSSLLFPRVSGNSKHIVIAPPAQPGPNQDAQSLYRASYLDVRIAFADQSSLNDDQVSSIAKHLSKLPTATPLNICDIRMIKFTSYKDHSHPQLMFNVANKVFNATRRLRNRKRSRQESMEESSTPSTKRTRSSPALLEVLQEHTPTSLEAQAPLSPSSSNRGGTPKS